MINLVTLSELQMKEVIIMQTGKRLGFIDDLEIDEQNGLITALVIVERQMKGSFFQKPEEKIIFWNQIVTIGTDIILVTEEQKNVSTTNNSTI